MAESLAARSKLVDTRFTVGLSSLAYDPEERDNARFFVFQYILSWARSGAADPAVQRLRPPST